MDEEEFDALIALLRHAEKAGHYVRVTYDDTVYTRYAHGIVAVVPSGPSEHFNTYASLDEWVKHHGYSV